MADYEQLLNTGLDENGNKISIVSELINDRYISPIRLMDSSGVEIVPATAALQTTGNTKLDSVIAALAGYLNQVPYNSSGTEILTEADPGVTKISDASIVIPTDKQAVYRNLDVDYSTALGISGSYTSSAVDGLTLRRVTGTVYANQAGTLNIQESKDGTTYRIITTQAITASTPYGFDAIFHSRYLRLNYVNGATAQTAFELVVYSSAD